VSSKRVKGDGDSRSRNAGYPAPPAQTRTCGIPASGSSVILAFAQDRTSPCWLFPAGRLARLVPVQLCPVRVAFAGYVLPSGPSPCSWLSHDLSTMPDKTPRWHAAVTCLPSIKNPRETLRLLHSPVSGFPLPCLNISLSYLHASSCWEPVGASRVLRLISSCMPRPVDSGGSPHPRQSGCFCVAFGGPLNPRHPQNVNLEAVPALQGARPPLRPTGFSVYASPALFTDPSAPPRTQDSIRVGG